MSRKLNILEVTNFILEIASSQGMSSLLFMRRTVQSMIMGPKCCALIIFAPSINFVTYEVFDVSVTTHLPQLNRNLKVGELFQNMWLLTVSGVNKNSQMMDWYLSIVSLRIGQQVIDCIKNTFANDAVI